MWGKKGKNATEHTFFKDSANHNKAASGKASFRLRLIRLEKAIVNC